MFTNNNTIIVSEDVTLVHSGEDYFSRLEKIISDSQSEIHLHFYIFEEDSIGIKISEALKKAASRNVKVYLLLDGFGSNSLSKKSIDDLRKNGINIRFFSTFFSANPFYFGRRLHYKLVVSDAKTVLIGGINIAEKYCGSTSNIPWLDYAVYIQSKKIAVPLQEFCKVIFFKKRIIKKSKIESHFQTQNKTTVRILQNDWLKRKNEIQSAYIKSIRNAKNEIVIVGCYFFPGRRLASALKIASQNGAKVKLILSGISDVPLLRKATHHLYTKLLRHNVELYEWDKSILHGKAAVVDNQWTTIGSFNLNNLSSYASIEMNVEIDSVDFAKEYLSHLNQIILQCQRITPESLKLKDRFFSKLTNWLSYRIIRTVIIIITYLPYKRFMKLD